MARRGRKRNMNARRRKTTVRGRRPIDNGTEFATKRRLELIGTGDPALSESALGIMFARGWIDESQYKAGSLFASFRQTAYGKSFAPVAHYGDYIDDFVGRTAEDRLSENEPYLLSITRAYLRGDRALKQASGLIRSFTWNVCILSIIPNWVLRPRRDPLSLSETRHYEDILAGLDLLMEEYGTNDAARKKKMH